MMYQEFVSAIGHEIDWESWVKVEIVYQWHPAIDNVKGKKQIADLFTNFGMTIIEDMLPRAMKVQKYDSEVRGIKKRKNALTEWMKTNAENITNAHNEATNALVAGDYVLLADIAEGLRGLDEMRKNMTAEIAELDARMLEIKKEMEA